MIWLLCDHNLVSNREKYEQVIFTFQLERHFFVLFMDSLSAQMNVPDTKFSGNFMEHLNHNASTLKGSICMSASF